MARYAREKCGANSVFWLATSAGRDNPSCPLFERRLCLGHIGQYNKLFIEQACLRTMPKYQPRSLRRALLSPHFGHPREPRGSQTAVRRLGTIIRSIFLCPIRSQHSLDRLEMVWWDSVFRGSSACAWKLSSRLFSRPEWLPLGLRGCTSASLKSFSLHT